MVTSGRACLRVRADCQKTASRPRALVKTIWERLSRPRSRTRSMAAPRRTQDRRPTRSTRSGVSGHSSAGIGWQYRALVRGQVPEVRNTIPPSSGSRSRYGSLESGSGLRAISSSTPSRLPADPGPAGQRLGQRPGVATRNLRADRADLVDLGDVTDVADVACMALLESAHHAGATYELAAPGRYTALELGGIISRTTWPRRWNC